MILQKFSPQFRQTGSLLLLVVLISACDPGQPSLGAANGGAGNVGGVATPLSDEEFAVLSLDQQYQVVNKLYGTLYKGMPVDDFYELSSGMGNATRMNPGLSPSTMRVQLQTNLADSERAGFDLKIVGDPDAVDESGASAPLEPLFEFDQNRPKQMPLARIHTYPLSRNVFSQWMAWHLANTILFSPAEEIDSADITDVQNLYRRLDLSIMNQRSIRQMVATHQRTVENWRRFRSPEDNTREMMEIYLGIFDNDAEVPLASKACQDLYLTDENDGYKLAYTDFPNDEPQLVLNTYVLDCGEFYDAVASHPLLIPRVVSVIVDYFFAGRELEERLAIVEAISASDPQTFEDVFTAILFSRTYLLDTERPKSFEENYLGLAARLQWDANPDVFRGMTGGRGSLARADMSEMGWPAMSLKLGRVSAIPFDSLSFANYHKALRETLILDKRHWDQELGLSSPEAPSPKPVELPDDNATARELASYQVDLVEYNEEVGALSAEDRVQYDSDLARFQIEQVLFKKIENFTTAELIDYLFLSVVQRRAIDEERNTLIAVANNNGHLDEEFSGQFVSDGRMDDVAEIVLDYLSRLPEGYYMPRI